MKVMDAKPLRRQRATRAEWAKLQEHFAFAACVHCGEPHQHLHHIAFKQADRGGDVIENLAPICFLHHDLIHSHGPGWERVAASIRQYVIVDNHRRQYAENILGERFNKRYPPLPNTDPQFQADFRRIHKVESEDIEGYSRP